MRRIPPPTTTTPMSQYGICIPNTSSEPLNNELSEYATDVAEAAPPAGGFTPAKSCWRKFVWELGCVDDAAGELAGVDDVG
jgi:hypothetical protein